MNYQIENSYITVKINSFGAELNSLKRNDEDIEYIWQGDEKYWARHSPVLFPIVGRLKDDEFIYKDKTYKMTQHGFARDYSFELVKKDDDYLKFKLTSHAESLKIYPFLFELYISYELIENKVVVSYEVKNLSNDNILFSIGAHPAFNWPLEDENKNSYYFKFKDISSTNRLFLDNDGLIYKSEELNISDNKIDLSEELFLNDALIFCDKEIKQISLRNKENSRFIQMNFEGFSHLGLWSKPSGASFVCIEPWYGIADLSSSNKIFEEKQGIISLKKDAVFSCFYSIEI